MNTLKRVFKCTLIGALMAAAILFCACGHEHVFGEWTTVKEASCTEDGLKERVCKCGEKETEVIPKTGHTFGEWTTAKEASCTEDGLKERVCKCGEKETEVIPKTGHTFGEWTVAVEPDYENEGVMERVCHCGEKETKPIPKKEIPAVKYGEKIVGDDFELTVYDLQYTKFVYRGNENKYAEFTVDLKNTGKTKYMASRFIFSIIYGDGYVYEESIQNATYIDPLETFTFDRTMGLTEEQFYDDVPKKILIQERDSYDKERETYQTCWYILIN
ncbi:MAG: hypothetical protein IJM76_05205 [Lachnospiraceae bacterium]|nr:hypothetical protein [Lachnospiraceae bacterium]